MNQIDTYNEMVNITNKSTGLRHRVFKHKIVKVSKNINYYNELEINYTLDYIDTSEKDPYKTIKTIEITEDDFELLLKN